LGGGSHPAHAMPLQGRVDEVKAELSDLHDRVDKLADEIYILLRVMVEMADLYEKRSLRLR